MELNQEERQRYYNQEQLHGAELWHLQESIWNSPYAAGTTYSASQSISTINQIQSAPVPSPLVPYIQRRHGSGAVFHHDYFNDEAGTYYQYRRHPYTPGLVFPNLAYRVPGQEQPSLTYISDPYDASLSAASQNLSNSPRVPLSNVGLVTEEVSFPLCTHTPTERFQTSVFLKPASRQGSTSTQLSQVSSPTRDDTDPRLQTIKVEDRDEILAYYYAAFHALQQDNCRLIAKAFIKVAEPKKQSRYPYNGGKKGPHGGIGDPEKTKPAWWPSGVTHREPDHLKKPERMHLIIYILRREGLLKRRHITTTLLQQSTRSVRQRFEPAERLEILDEIFRVRQVEEEYENGEIDGSTEIQLTDRYWTFCLSHRNADEPTSPRSPYPRSNRPPECAPPRVPASVSRQWK